MFREETFLGSYGNINAEFIDGLIEEIQVKIAYVTNRDIANIKYNLGINEDVDDYFFLPQYIEILNGILACNKCYESEQIQNIVSNIKNQLVVI